MTKTYLVTGMGCRRREEPFVVPAGVQVIFYRMRPSPRRLSAVRTPLDELMVAAKLFSATAASPGESVPAAFCWARGAEVPPSGVYRRSTGAQVMDLSNTSAYTPVALSHVVRELAMNREGRPTIIHWLVQPADAAPVRRSWRLQHPPRLFNGDGDESGHAPLDESASTRAWERAGLEETDQVVPPGWVMLSHRP